VAHRSAE
jgi:dCTP diphosphatase